MAIAFDSAASSGVYSTSTTYSHTTSGSDRLLILGVTIGTGVSISGTPTYAGVSMTQIGTMQSGAGTVFDKTYFYYLIAPATGANDVVVNASSTAYIYPCTASYTGVDQTNPINVSGQNTTSGTTITQSVTTTADNAWLVGYCVACTSNTLVEGANTTLRVSNGPNWSEIGDSNGPKTPTGSYALNWSGSSDNRVIFVSALKPASSSSTVNSNFFALM